MKATETAGDYLFRQPLRAATFPRGEGFGDTVIIYQHVSKHNKRMQKNAGGKGMLSRKEMMEYILGRLEEATDLEIEQYYWFFQCEEE